MTRMHTSVPYLAFIASIRRTSIFHGANGRPVQINIAQAQFILHQGIELHKLGAPGPVLRKATYLAALLSSALWGSDFCMLQADGQVKLGNQAYKSWSERPYHLRLLLLEISPRYQGK